MDIHDIFQERNGLLWELKLFTSIYKKIMDWWFFCRQLFYQERQLQPRIYIRMLRMDCTQYRNHFMQPKSQNLISGHLLLKPGLLELQFERSQGGKIQDAVPVEPRYCNPQFLSMFRIYQ